MSYSHDSSAPAYKGVTVTHSLDKNGLKKLLIIGKTGTGKSTLCNVLTGNDPKAKIFPVSSAAESCTQATKFANVWFNGDKSKHISLIDTIGFDDATKNDDAAIIAELVGKLRDDCDHVNLFVIAVNGQSPRLDGSLLTMIRIFEGMFSKDFWKQVIIVFTRIPQDAKTKKRREKQNDKSDEDLAADYIKLVERQFKDCNGLKYLYMDATYDKEDEDETDAFESALSELWKTLKDCPPLSTDHVQNVETDNAKLKRQIEEQKQAREDAEKLLREELEKLKNENKNLSDKELEKKLEKLVKNHEDQGFSVANAISDVTGGATLGLFGGPVVAAIGAGLGFVKSLGRLFRG